MPGTFIFFEYTHSLYDSGYAQPTAYLFSPIDRSSTNSGTEEDSIKYLLMILRNGTTLQNWKQKSDGSQEAEIVIFKGDDTKYLGLEYNNRTQRFAGASFINALSEKITLKFSSRKSLAEVKKAVRRQKYR